MILIADVRGLDTEQKFAILEHFKVTTPTGKPVTTENVTYFRADVFFIDKGRRIVTHSSWHYAEGQLSNNPDKYRLLKLRLTAKTGYVVEEIPISQTVVVDGMLYRLVGKYVDPALTKKENKA